ncbi:unnamed protein product [Nesidiocoris tenuis]|uniref:PRA1 family protein n=1 Tax=Nesidiocoris tenuis TaxID=355587 RepID=A0A6H5H485_9HEMI|nr:unnamed protein product [Nesidiocoris tenuis]
MSSYARCPATRRHVSPYVPLLPTTDIQSHAGFVEMLVIPLVLYMSAFAIVYLAGIAMIVCIVFQGQAYNNILLRAGSKYLSKAVFTAAVLAMTFAQTTLYRLPIIVSGVFICVTLHQLIAPWFTEEEEPIPQLVDATGAPIGDFKTQLADMFQASSLSSLGLVGAYLPISEPSSSASDLPAGDDRTDDADSVSDEDDEDGGKGDAVGQSGGKSADQEGNGTPSSDASTSSFEQISEREIAS